MEDEILEDDFVEDLNSSELLESSQNDDGDDDDIFWTSYSEAAEVPGLQNHDSEGYAQFDRIPQSHDERAPRNDVERTQTSRYVLRQLDEMLARQTEGMDKDPPEPVCILLRIRPRNVDELSSPPRYTKYVWPETTGGRRRSPGGYCAVLAIICHIASAIRQGRVITKRDLYYKEKELFGSQAFVNRVVDDLAFTLGVYREDLNVVAAAKGLVCGCLTIHLRNGSTVDCLDDSNGILIPHCVNIQELDYGSADWVLVVEKEAIFRSLALRRFAQSRSGIIVTGKGYPDLETRRFLNMICTNSTIPIYTLTDFNPHGIEIFSVYKNGSVTLSHENERLIAPRAQWIGVRADDFDAYSGRQTLQINNTDRKKATKMLTSCQLGETERSSLMAILETGKKGEIEAMGSGDLFETWLENRLVEHTFNE